jgi:2-amino-4-hydroxy-6-hydroxymethyldihydropteridine diphosphokinase
MHQACLALGSNVGDRVAILDHAVASLSTTVGISRVSVSSYYETPPIGGPDGQGAFVNACAVLQTSLLPDQLFKLFLEIEANAGRVRKVRWGERTLDLDLLLFDDFVSDHPELSIPHPRMSVRRFVLGPLAEIAPLMIDPITGRTISELNKRLDLDPNVFSLLGLHPKIVEQVFQKIDRGIVVVSDLGGSARQTISPTFIATCPELYVRLRDPADSCWDDLAIERRVPILCPGYSDPFRLEGASVPIESELLDRITNEILAACQAVRPESLGVPVAAARVLP